MRFDPLSFLIGFGTASGLAAAAWATRTNLAQLQRTTGKRIDTARSLLGQAADERYTREIGAYLQRRHIAGGLFKLSEVLIEPRLLPAPPPALPALDDVEIGDIFEIVPQIHDLPFSYAPFNVETIALSDLTAGDRHVAILGNSGLGKSTTLTTLALMALGEVSFESLEDLTAQTIQEQEEGLSESEREERAREREMMQERALEKLQEAEERRRELFVTSEGTEIERVEHPDLTTRVPILVDLRDLEFDPALYGKNNQTLDPAEPVIRAVQRQVTPVTAQIVGSALYPMLEAGRALVLLDGYDDLGPDARRKYYHWLKQFITQYNDNMIVISGPATGYEPLVNLGFTPTFLRAWREGEFARLVERWGQAWAAHSGTAPTPETIHRLSAGNRARYMFDVTLKIWTGMAEDARETGRTGWYDAFVHRQLAATEISQLATDILPDLAVRLLEAQHPLTAAALLDNASPEAESTGKEAEKTIDTALLAKLVESGLLVKFGSDRYDFPHWLITSYLAALALEEAGPDYTAEIALEPAWQDAFSFAAAKMDLMPAISRRMETPPDLLYSTLFGIVRWVPDAPPDAAWRSELFRRLGAALMAPQQYPAVRERAMASMIAAREPNVLYVFRQAIQQTQNPDIKRISCIGLGALGLEEAIPDLEKMMQDENRDVQLAAALALGAIGVDRAIEVMIHGLFQGANELRRAIAEALAAIPGEGHNTLREAINAQEIEIRRAAVYGLSRVRSPWALTELYRTMFRDSQWYVRSAAETAFLAAESPDHEGPQAHPEPDTLAWLVDWAGERGQVVPAGTASRQILIRVLQEGDPQHKVLAARTLGRLGHIEGLKPLYAALRDRNEQVRGAAYSALSELQLRLGAPLPGLV